MTKKLKWTLVTITLAALAWPAWAQVPRDAAPPPLDGPRRERQQKRDGSCGECPLGGPAAARGLAPQAGPLSPEGLDHIFKALDADGDGVIDRAELGHELPKVLQHLRQRIAGSAGAAFGPRGMMQGMRGGPQGMCGEGPRGRFDGVRRGGMGGPPKGRGGPGLDGFALRDGQGRGMRGERGWGERRGDGPPMMDRGPFTDRGQGRSWDRDHDEDWGAGPRDREGGSAFQPPGRRDRGEFRGPRLDRDNGSRRANARDGQPSIEDLQRRIDKLERLIQQAERERGPKD